MCSQNPEALGDRLAQPGQFVGDVEASAPRAIVVFQLSYLRNASESQARETSWHVCCLLPQRSRQSAQSIKRLPSSTPEMSAMLALANKPWIPLPGVLARTHAPYTGALWPQAHVDQERNGSVLDQSDKVMGKPSAIANGVHAPFRPSCTWLPRPCH